jgi:FdhE protein
LSEIIRDGSLAGGIPSIPQFRPVELDVFGERAERFAALAPGHSLEAYLRFAAALSRVQDQVLRGFPDVPLPDAQALEQCRAHGLPPLSVDGYRRAPAWQAGLRKLLSALDAQTVPAQAQPVLDALRTAPADALESAAGHLLAGAFAEIDAGQAPFVAAALQVYWVRMAGTLGEAGLSPQVQYGLCPVCGSYPVASVVRIGGAQQGLRYLVCSLCASEWHAVRVKCSACASTKGISYLSIEGASEAVKAEVCDECKTYLKIFYLEKDTQLVPAADDLATLSLDILVDEQGYNRVGPNLLFAVGREA